MTRFCLSFILVLMMPFCAQAASYSVDYASSTVKFSGTHASAPFDGIFENWTAEIVFDPSDLEHSSIKAVLDASSAQTGSKMYDGALPKSDWFDIKNYPEIVFQSRTITFADGLYHASGDLTLKGITKPVDFDFSLSDLTVSPVTAQASFVIDRLAYDIGKESDAAAEWVGQDIQVLINLKATVE